MNNSFSHLLRLSSEEGRIPRASSNAFVMHFRVSSDVAQGRLAGWVEHVASGQAAHFAALEELLAFIARVLTPGNRASPSGDGV